MKPILWFLFLSSLLILSQAPVLAAPAAGSAVFTSVKGKVEVRKTGKKNRSVKKNSTASEGDRIVVAKGAKATLRLPDGSELRIESKADFRLVKLAEAGKDKTFRFKLLMGKIWAKVKKLGSPRSSFEIEAGGVVCGVRGTEYSVDYDPDTGKVDLFVLEGNVWTSAGNETFNYGPGSQGHFTDGKPEGNSGTQGEGAHKHGETQGEGVQGSTFNPFYGINGNQQDHFGPLADLTGGSDGIAGQAGDDNLLGLGAHTLVLQFNFPETP